ncbi:putative protein 23 [Haloarcula hispanica icosahedral virus 2]|uniref:Uncharacterized protein n=1 Tax=Haloarcula hispanica icosahedral virus 2 TaxID=1154689 RepID=H9AZX9_9VIRU|nr:putative protein 23 [Haloarcula hispanica icosahedral virus 2]AFD02304.1 putative protein 23 [Haloarcula hispanica icosahedral virus 2]
MMPQGTQGLSKPPEGVVSGDSIPRENEQSEQQRAAIETLVGLLKARPGYKRLDDDEIREIAKERLQ